MMVDDPMVVLPTPLAPARVSTMARSLAVLLSHIGGTNDFRYSGYRYGYYNNPPGPIEPIPTCTRN